MNGGYIMEWKHLFFILLVLAIIVSAGCVQPQTSNPAQPTDQVQPSGNVTTSFGNQRAAAPGITPASTNNSSSVITPVNNNRINEPVNNYGINDEGIKRTGSSTMTTATNCTPLANMNMTIYLVDSTGNTTQIAQTLTDANGVFSFTLGAIKKSATGVTYSFGFIPNETVGFIKDDGISTSSVHMAQSTAGPTYNYTLCLGEGTVVASAGGGNPLQGLLGKSIEGGKTVHVPYEK